MVEQKPNSKIPYAQQALLLLFMGSLLVTAGIQYCTPPLQKGDKLYIVATNNIIADPLQYIFGEKAIVEMIIPHDTDPHSYTPTLSDNQKLANADFICAMGLHFEGSLHTIVEKIAQTDPAKVCIFSDALSPEEIKYESNNTAAANPHYYLHPTLFEKAVIKAVKQIEKQCAVDDIDHEAKLIQYCNGLQELLQEGKKVIQRIAPNHRTVCMDHATFEYAAEAFGFETHALKGIATLGEHGLRDREMMVHRVMDKGLNAIFCEISKNQKSMLSIVEDCERQNHKITCKNLNTDALQAGKTYQDLILDNLTTIANALA